MPAKATNAGPLTRAFGLASGGELVAFTGGGGKTSLVFALARELAAAGRRVVATTTTRIAQRPPVWMNDSIHQL